MQDNNKAADDGMMPQTQEAIEAAGRSSVQTPKNDADNQSERLNQSHDYSNNHNQQENQLSYDVATQLAKQLNADTERRLHPKSWLFILFDNLTTLIVFFVMFMFNIISDDDMSYLFDMPLMLPIFLLIVSLSLLAPMIRLLTFRFQIVANEMRIRWGMLNKQQRHIPLHKVHNVAISQNLLHRFFNVAVVTLESAGSGQESEVTLKVLSYADALLLEQALTEQRLQPQSQPQSQLDHVDMHTHMAESSKLAMQTQSSQGQVLPKQVLQGSLNQTTESNQHKYKTLLTLPDKELFKYGLISNTGIALGGVFTIITSPDRLFMWIIGKLGVTIPEDADIGGLAYINQYFFGQQSPLMQGIMWCFVLLSTLVSIIVVGKVISVVTAFINLYNFQLMDNGKQVSIEKGLFTRKKSRVPVDKIQVWRVEESILHRLFKRQSLKLDTAILAGNQGQANNMQRGISELIPLTTADHMQQLLTYWQQPDISDYDYCPVHPKAWRRLFFRWFFWVALVLPIAVLLLPSFILLWFMLAVLVLVMGGMISKRRANNMGVVITETHLIWRDGWLNRTFCITELTHAHAIAITHSPFDRRYDMATLIIDTVGGTMRQARLTMRYLEEDVARTITEDVRMACYNL